MVEKFLRLAFQLADARLLLLYNAVGKIWEEWQKEGKKERQSLGLFTIRLCNPYFLHFAVTESHNLIFAQYNVFLWSKTSWEISNKITWIMEFFTHQNIHILTLFSAATMGVMYACSLKLSVMGTFGVFIILSIWGINGECDHKN